MGIYRGDGGHRIVDKSLAIEMSMTLAYRDKIVIVYRPSTPQWWITGFNPNYLNLSHNSLKATFTLKFSSDMFYAFRSRYYDDDRWRFYEDGYYATLRF